MLLICFLKTKSLDVETVLALRTNAQSQGETIHLGKLVEKCHIRFSVIKALCQNDDIFVTLVKRAKKKDKYNNNNK